MGFNMLCTYQLFADYFIKFANNHLHGKEQSSPEASDSNRETEVDGAASSDAANFSIDVSNAHDTGSNVLLCVHVVL